MKASFLTLMVFACCGDDPTQQMLKAKLTDSSYVVEESMPEDEAGSLETLIASKMCDVVVSHPGIDVCDKYTVRDQMISLQFFWDRNGDDDRTINMVLELKP